MDNDRLWCFLVIANGPFLSYSGEQSSFNFTLLAKIDEEKAAGAPGPGLGLAQGSGASARVIVEIL